MKRSDDLRILLISLFINIVWSYFMDLDSKAILRFISPSKYIISSWFLYLYAIP